MAMQAGKHPVVATNAGLARTPRRSPRMRTPLRKLSLSSSSKRQKHIAGR